jgi:phospholipid transport system substrate-binding protein
LHGLNAKFVLMLALVLGAPVSLAQNVAPDDTEVTVKSLVKQSGPAPIAMDYDMERTPAGWKVFDIKVAGISLVTTYRDSFAAKVREDGVDGLIKALEEKNRQGDSRSAAPAS